MVSAKTALDSTTQRVLKSAVWGWGRHYRGSDSLGMPEGKITLGQTKDEERQAI